MSDVPISVRLTEKIGDGERLTDKELNRFLYAGQRLFQERYDVWPDDIDYETGKPNQIHAETDKNTVYVGKEHSTLAYKTKRRLLVSEIKEVYDAALKELTDTRAQEINDRYSFTHAVPDYEHVVFDDISSDGNYNRGSETIRIDYGFMDDIAIEGTGTNELEGLIDHELTHALHYNHSNAVGHLSDRIDNKTETHEEYKYHPDRAGIEALAQFEQHQTLDRRDRIEAITAVLETQPDAVHVTLEDWAAYGDTLIEDPYDHGMVAAAVLETAPEHDPREELLQVRDAASIEHLIQDGLEDLGVPDYIGAAQTIHDFAARSADPEQCVRQYLTQVGGDERLGEAHRATIMTAAENVTTHLGIDIDIPP